MTANLKLLNFTIAGEQYLLPIGIISEILRYQTVTSVPTIPDVVHGVINLRGSYIPVIDLAKRLLLREGLSISQRSCVVITECTDGEQQVTVGLLIDEVNDFIDVDPEMIADPPRFGHAIAADLIRGMIQIESQDYLVLNVDTLLDLTALLELLESVEDSVAVKQQLNDNQPHTQN